MSPLLSSTPPHLHPFVFSSYAQALKAVLSKPASWFSYAVRNFGFHNLTQRSLTANQQRALGIGLHFIRKPRALSEQELRQCLQTFGRRVRLRWAFRHSATRPPRFRVPNPTWEPPETPEVLWTFTQQLEELAVARLRAAPRWHRPNLPHAIAQAWNSLVQDPSLVISPADKNLGTVLSTREQYDNAVQEHVGDASKYRPLSRNHAIAKLTLFRKQSLRVMNALLPRDDSSSRWYSAEVAQRMKQVEENIPAFYGLWKVHKARLCLRPIVPCFRSVTTPASQYLDYILRPVVQRLWTVLPDSTRLVQVLETTDFPADALLLTLDVEALYPSIPQEEGIAKVAELCRRHPSLVPPQHVEPLCYLLKLVLTNNILRVGDQTYQQIHGTAMGTPVAVQFANLFMFAVEEPLVTALRDSGHVLLYRRFVDDLFVVLRGMSPNEFAAAFNTLHPNIHVTGAGGTAVDFLDLHVFQGPRWAKHRRFDLRTHQKRLNAYLYLPFASYHSVASKKGFIKGELQRYVRTCSSVTDFSMVRNLFFQRLRSRGYPASLLRRCFASVRYADRHTLVWPEQKEPSTPPLVLTVPHNPSLHDIGLAELVHSAYDRLPVHIRDALPRPILALRNAPKLGAQAAQQRTPRQSRTPAGEVQHGPPAGRS